MKLKSKILALATMCMLLAQPSQARSYPPACVLGTAIVSGIITLACAACGIGIAVMNAKAGDCESSSIGCYSGYTYQVLPKPNCTLLCGTIKVCVQDGTNVQVRPEKIKDCSDLRSHESGLRKATLGTGISAGLMWLFTLWLAA